MALKIIYLTIMVLGISCNVFSLNEIRINVLSIEKKKETLNITLNDNENKISIFLLSNPKEQICISDFRSLEGEIEIINQFFVKINFRTFGGSGIKLRKTIFICVSNKKLNESIDLVDYESYVVNNIKSRKNKVVQSITFLPSSPNNWNHLFAIQGSTFEKNNKLMFNFDNKNLIFYNEVINLNGNYNMLNSNSKIYFGNQKKLSIKLEIDQYVFIDSKWYRLFNKNNLEMVSFCK